MDIKENAGSGINNAVLEIDLTNGQIQKFPISTGDRKKYLGGHGLGFKYYSERIKAGIDPLGEKNVLVIGPAGGNLVKYASVVSGNRFLGRGGIGAEMGSKNINRNGVSSIDQSS